MKLKPTLITGYTLTREDIEEVLFRIVAIDLYRFEDGALVTFGPQPQQGKLATLGDYDFDLIGLLDCPADPEWKAVWGYLVGTFTYSLIVSTLRFESPFR